MSATRIVDTDLTAKARIRNAALELFGDLGEDGTSMRQVASAAGVTIGLVVHHYGTKDGLREAVEGRIVDLFGDAIAAADATGSARDVVAARDAAVAAMLVSHPEVVAYLRRAVLDATGHRGQLLERLATLSLQQVTELRASGMASTRQRDSSQVIGIMVRQLGQLLLQPLVDRVWEQLAGADADDRAKPELLVGVRESS